MFCNIFLKPLFILRGRKRRKYAWKSVLCFFSELKNGDRFLYKNSSLWICLTMLFFVVVKDWNWNSTYFKLVYILPYKKFKSSINYVFFVIVLILNKRLHSRIIVSNDFWFSYYEFSLYIIITVFFHLFCLSNFLLNNVSINELLIYIMKIKFIFSWNKVIISRKKTQ